MKVYAGGCDMNTPEFINSADVSVTERLVLRKGAWQKCKLAVRYGRVVNVKGGNCLIDTGYTRAVISGDRSWYLKMYCSLIQPQLTKNALETPDPTIDTVLLTHLHADHCAGLSLAPNAKIITNGAAYDYFKALSPLRRSLHGVFFELLPADFERRLIRLESLPTVDAPNELGLANDIFGDGSVLAVPLPGHLLGHTGFLWPNLDHPFLYAADVQWLHRAVVEDRAPGLPLSLTMDNKKSFTLSSQKVKRFLTLGGQVAYCHEPHYSR